MIAGYSTGVLLAVGDRRNPHTDQLYKHRETIALIASWVEIPVSVGSIATFEESQSPGLIASCLRLVRYTVVCWGETACRIELRKAANKRLRPRLLDSNSHAER
jgi:hypothetical protein